MVFYVILEVESSSRCSVSCSSVVVVLDGSSGSSSIHAREQAEGQREVNNTGVPCPDWFM